jgi:hypothetical protein
VYRNLLYGFCWKFGFFFSLHTLRNVFLLHQFLDLHLNEREAEFLKFMGKV